MGNRRRLIVAALGVLALGAGADVAAAADEFTQYHYTIDNDSIAVGKKDGTDDRVFSGNLEFFHDSRRIRANLTGLLRKLDYKSIKIVFTFNGGATETLTHTVGPDATARRANITSSDRADVLKATITVTGTYACSPPFCNEYSRMSQTVIAGDSPQSKGTCEQLDTDSINLESRDADLDATVKWSCHVDSGFILMRADIALFRNSGAQQPASVTGRINYADGTSQLVFSQVVNASRPSYSFTRNSTTTKQARSISLSITNNDGNIAGPASAKIGDA